MTNVTIAENVATGSNGGGMWLGHTPTGTLLNCTIANNHSTAAGQVAGAIFGEGLTLVNTVIAGNTAMYTPTCDATRSDGSGNLQWPGSAPCTAMPLVADPRCSARSATTAATRRRWCPRPRVRLAGSGPAARRPISSATRARSRAPPARSKRPEPDHPSDPCRSNRGTGDAASEDMSQPSHTSSTYEEIAYMAVPSSELFHPERAASTPFEHELATAVRASLAAEARLRREPIEISVHGNCVRLTGRVASWDARVLAERLARHVAGVVSVENELG